ncbi:kinase-like domain-containing protein [Rhizophagus irregularis DAOM 181602=DAOM 197198]|uniref:Kinase-like domain-containing protein n=1 Tax=Rhizophagus irregularis (strain DAOM 181602 / DAOM 197198 / MUCL 43194) TaxID=747089 RepID=A0A2P4QZT9_RHIID|nr:kinase-like domain-containing protein [Rhizophagus irregularis DAOM 181602=DAOM 197198]POG83088.1 kinase-like domain-containing protein [Rhizophagus irregularis DAOM 181602=DAOM 197198]|eukprot:XP_025189954.1 kinase-like domain-containing protein [Rhizophagus irregularis DAOM 181602=DAOM 197198]
MYLKDHPELTWDDRIKLAYQITEGIKFLQGEKILHRDLHSGNIVVHQGEAKIIDLGIAKSMETQTNIHSGVFGVIALGVLMWEISSGKPPFADGNISENLLKYDLINGHREEPVPDTPDKYLKLYKSCWEPEPNKRPSINQVFSKLVKLGREMSIQDFQDIKCDDDDMQSIQDNDNNTDAQAANINGEADDNYDLDVPNGTI